LVFRILSQVGVVSNCFLNTLNEARTLGPDAMLQFILKSRVTHGCHGELVYQFFHRSL